MSSPELCVAGLAHGSSVIAYHLFSIHSTASPVCNAEYGADDPVAS